MVANPRKVYLEELNELLDLLCTVFKSTNRLYFEHILCKDPWMKERLTYVIEADGKLVSHISAHMRPIHYGSVVLPMGGIGHVATLEAYRGRHYSTHIMQTIIEGMNQRKTPLSLLFTGIQPFYERLNWFVLPRFTYHWKAQDLAALPQVAYTVQPARLLEAFEVIETLYRTLAPTFPGSLARTSDYWRNWWTWNDPQRKLVDDERTCLIAESEGEPVAYGFFHPADSNLKVAELLALPGHTAAMQALVQRAGELFDAESFELLTFKRHPFTDALQQAGVPLKTTESTHSMLRFNSLYEFFIQALPELQRRLKTKPLQDCSLVFDHFSGPVQLALASGELTVAPVQTAQVTLRLPDVVLAKMLFGYDRPSTLLAAAQVELAGPCLDLLEALFPPAYAQYWPGDGF